MIHIKSSPGIRPRRVSSPFAVDAGNVSRKRMMATQKAAPSRPMVDIQHVGATHILGVI